jgi:DNA topoisomerase-1
MVIRWGRNGKFLACSGFPKCRNAKPITEDAEGNVTVAEEEKTDRVCPACGRPMAVKNGKRGRFLACTGYPECKTAQPYPIGAPCGRPGCDGELVERRSSRGSVFYSCNKYPECKFAVNERPYKEACAKCGKAHFFVGEGARKRVLCLKDKGCVEGMAAAGEPAPEE